jgi:hypothetical protein
MEAVRPDWLRRRNRGIHMTIRDVDCEGFDVEAMVRTYARWRVTYFSFFAAGYVTTFPTRLALQRVSPWLHGRDLAGEIIAVSHRYDIRAIPMIDLGQLPEAAFLAHPEWAARDAQGQPVRATDGPLYRACPLGGYIREYSREMVKELLDGVKFGGGSYGFGNAACHCPACTERYPADTGYPLPDREDWQDSAWQAYHAWKGRMTAETVRHLVRIVREEAPGVPVVGNAVCFGDPSWTLNSSLDIEELAEIEDIVQVEVQSRFRYDPLRDTGAWQYLRWPSETARYMTSVSDRPIWSVCSYFLAWPWRRNAVPPAEQMVYLAQMAANGATPMVNLSGGPPAVHEDARGFQAIEQVYTFMADHAELYEDSSAANVALMYSQRSLEHYGDRAMRQYVDGLRGYELALDEAHIPYDILSCRVLTAERLARYRAVVLPAAAVLSDAEAAVLRAYVQGGGGLVADDACGLLGPGVVRQAPVLDDLLGVERAGEPVAAAGEVREMTQAYMRVTGEHPAVRSVSDLSLLPLPGRVSPVKAAQDTQVPLRRAAPFRVFPEGWAYPEHPDSREPMLVTREAGAGRTAFFATQLGRSFTMLHFPPLGDLIADTVRWAAGDDIPLRVEAPATLEVSLRLCDAGVTVHCVNLTGGERYMREIIPLHDCHFSLREDAGRRFGQAVQVSSGAALPLVHDSGWATITVPVLGAYDILLFERTGEG